MKSDSLLVQLFPSYLADCGNDTYWLPFSPRVDRIEGNEAVYYTLIGFEVVLLLLSFVSMAILILVFWRHQIVHINLTAMLVFHGSLYCSTIFARFFQIAFESHLIYLAEPGCFPMPTLVVARSTAYISVILLMTGTIIERALATYFVADYEGKRRLWISSSILLFNFVTSVLLASQIIRGVINGVFFGIALLWPVFASIIIFRLLLIQNEKRLARLNNMIKRQRANISEADEYSLSLRLQLRENIWTMQKLFRMSLFVIPLSCICIPILSLPAFLLQSRSQWWLLELIIEATNMAIAAVAPLFTAYVIYVFEKVKKLVIPKKWRRKRAVHGKNRKVTVTVIQPSEADQHFHQMNSLFQRSLELKQRK